MSMRDAVFRDSMSVSVANVLSKLVSLFSAALVARMLSPEGFGTLDFAITAYSCFFPLFMLNIPMSISLALPSSKQRNKVFSTGLFLAFGLLLAWKGVTGLV